MRIRHMSSLSIKRPGDLHLWPFDLWPGIWLCVWCLTFSATSGIFLFILDLQTLPPNHDVSSKGCLTPRKNVPFHSSTRAIKSWWSWWTDVDKVDEVLSRQRHFWLVDAVHWDGDSFVHGQRTVAWSSCMSVFQRQHRKTLRTLANLTHHHHHQSYQ